ncbi:nucleotidyltransferase domain-containing protein [Amycolatopsis balhimycina]|uniref:nucleotidyltransferase domain-containing protein n=1 Tax=Amycolatopsis balhimycina TaxID=208443 RepID=UPI001FE13635|nr:nucleotidyltransferase domain-containing protein [Amycolatopsis balhimycina]
MFAPRSTGAGGRVLPLRLSSTSSIGEAGLPLVVSIIVFTPEQREQLRDSLISAARQDTRIVAAALTGSAALGRQDEWSDIDLALSVARDADYQQVVADWTDRMTGHDVVTHLDMPLGDALFRVFLLRNTLQVDLSFWPEAEFGATGPKFRLLFGAAEEQEQVRPPAAEWLIGMGWLYALHARSSIARGRVWQAGYMINGMREQAFALACLRYELPAVQARGTDDLPAEVTASFSGTLVRSLDSAELHRAFAATAEALLAEAVLADPDLADRIGATLRELAAVGAG